jgi:RNA 2',3'-cyclic 3'-phosphodiesterase
MNTAMTATSRKPARTHRLFVALPLSAAVSEVVSSAQEQLQEYEWPVKWVEPELVHITMKFLGDVEATRVPDIQDALEDVAARSEIVNLTTGSCGAFPAPFRPRVFWLGLDGDTEALVDLAARVDKALGKLGFEAEDRPFQPHITIGRLRRQQVPPTGFEEISDCLDIPAVDVAFDRIQLVRSVLSNSGPVYTVFAERKLGLVNDGDAAEAVEVVEHG